MASLSEEWFNGTFRETLNNEDNAAALAGFFGCAHACLLQDRFYLLMKQASLTMEILDLGEIQLEYNCRHAELLLGLCNLCIISNTPAPDGGAVILASIVGDALGFDFNG